MAREADRAAVIAQFRAYAVARLATEPGWLEPLRGKDLLCWCTKPTDPPGAVVCHGQVILELLAVGRRGLRTTHAAEPVPALPSTPTA